MLKFIRYPLTRLVIAIVVVMGALAAATLLWGQLADHISIENESLAGILNAIYLAAIALVVYGLYVRVVEGRPVSELSLGRALPEISSGLLVGAGMISVVIVILYWRGYYEVTGTRSLLVLATPIAIAITSGVIEEIALRGIVFRIMEEWLGTWIALAFSALLFGALHLANPGATLWSSIAIAIEAGLLLGAVYMVTRRLWAVIGLHAGWNFTLGGVYSGAVSGGEAQGVLAAEFSGPELMTGGAFGVEASVVTIGVGLFLTLIYFARAMRRGHYVASPWGWKKNGGVAES